MKTQEAFRRLHILLLIACATSAGATLLPEGLTFGPQAMGTTSSPQVMTVFNTEKKSVVVNSITISNPQFALVGGTVPLTIPPGQSANYLIAFTPSSAGAFSAQVTASISRTTARVSLYGQGVSATAAANVSATSLNFTNQPLGASSSQSLVISNTGTSAFSVTAVTVTYPFTQTGFSSSTTILPGSQLTLQISFFPVALGPSTGTLLVNYDVLPPAGVTLTGSGTAASSLAIDTFPKLPTAIQAAAYQATLTSTAGIGAVTWSLANGSSLPLGLNLSGSGIISGTLDPSVGVGTYSFTVQATDSNSPPSTASAALTLPIDATTGANCNDIDFDVAGTTNPIVPINDLGANYYLGVEEGGLYANGSNVDNPAHHSFGVSAAAGIQPLDSNGNPSPSGKYVFLSVGQSTTQQAFVEFMALAGSDPATNSHLVLVNGAQGGATALQYSLLDSLFWSVVTTDLLADAGVTPQQVVAAWINATDAGMIGTFPSDMTALQSQLESIAQNLLVLFPNIKIAYYSSMPYTGYSNGIVDLVPEPQGYETGFAVKNAIQDQVNGNANLNYDPSQGPVLAPWMDWGPYYWANGLLPRSDGLVWSCVDYKPDGTHPSNPTGITKVSTQLLNFLKAADTATPWFLAP